MATSDPTGRRTRMVTRDLRGRGITDEVVLGAMSTVPRERFVPPPLAGTAYDDSALPIDAGQTISQPYIVALMTEALELGPNDRVLEIGTGSGYAAAVLSRVAAEVWTIERHRTLVDQAIERLAGLGYDNVRIRVGDGTLGWSDAAPFDAIVVTAAAPSVPPALTDQLADGGRLVIPVGEETGDQELLRVRRTGDELHQDVLSPVRFVPLVGKQGWPA
jgi:protein-L-isoaspartate(D-aspartate) O-methyltransferase